MSAEPSPAVIGQGDLSWVIAMIDWMVDRQFIPGWVAAMIKFALHTFVPAVRGNPQARQNMDDLHRSWDQFVATHPAASPYTIGGAGHITRG